MIRLLAVAPGVAIWSGCAACASSIPGRPLMLLCDAEAAGLSLLSRAVVRRSSDQALPWAARRSAAPLPAPAPPADGTPPPGRPSALFLHPAPPAPPTYPARNSAAR